MCSTSLVGTHLANVEEKTPGSFAGNSRHAYALIRQSKHKASTKISRGYLMTKNSWAISSCSIVNITEASLSPLRRTHPLIARATGIWGNYAKNMNTSNFMFGGELCRKVMRTCEKSCLYDPHVKALSTPAGRNCRWSSTGSTRKTPGDACQG